MRYFEKLGRIVDERWRAKNYDVGSFPDIALAAMREMPPESHVSAADVMRWVVQSPALPRQDLDSKFGDPPVTVFRTDAFFIQVLFWMDGMPGIHDHAFSGAFYVLEGASVHTTYEFTPSVRVRSGFQIGDVRFNHSEYLKVGDGHAIRSGRRFIHSLFHLDRPSVSIVVRTYVDPESLPQYGYYKPFLALRGFDTREQHTRRVEMLRVLGKLGRREELQSLARELVHWDLETAYGALEACYGFTTPQEFGDMLAAARARHGEAIDFVPAVLRENGRQAFLKEQRARVTDGGQRYLLALLLNVPNLDSVCALVASRHQTGDPIGHIVEWIKGLSRLRDPATGKSVLLHEFSDAHMCIIDGLLRRWSLQRIQGALSQQYDRESVDALTEQIHAVHRDLKGHRLLEPLFSDHL